MYHERKPIRLFGYDYSKSNLYFITSCIKKRHPFFGEIRDGKMILSPEGIIANDQWYWMGRQYGYLQLHEFVVMPDHIHGILEIGVSPLAKHDRGQPGNNLYQSLQNIEENNNNHKNYDGKKEYDLFNYSTNPNPESYKIKPLDQLIGAYKTTVSKQIHLAGNYAFTWQRRFHDHIIRNEESYQRITNYIINNPRNWGGSTMPNLD